MSVRQPVLEHDWYAGEIPDNVAFGKHVYVDTSYSFASFLSKQEPGLVLGDGAGVYIRASFVVGPDGQVCVGSYTCLNGTYLICHNRITIGSYCLLAWGAVITDTWAEPAGSLAARRRVLQAAAMHPDRWLGAVSKSRPVILEDNVWVGFDSVIMPGVILGQGCVVGCKTIVVDDIPPYAVVAGNPPRVIRQLDPDDTKAAHNAR